MTIETIRGTVRISHFCNPDGPWMAGKIELDDGVFGFAGKIAADVGDIVEVSGNWTNDPKWGRQFKVDTGIVRMDETPAALEHLLASHPDFKGIGPARAKKIVEAALFASHDGELASSLIENAQRIADESGVALDIVTSAAQVWSGKKGHFDALALLGDQGWTNAQATRIINAFGENAPALVHGDPYMLIGKIKRFGFRTVDAVALKMGTTKNDPGRIAAGVAFCLDRNASNGNTWTTRDALVLESLEELKPDSLRAEDLVHTTIEDMIQTGLMMADESPLGTEVVADTRLAAREFRVFDRILKGLADDTLGELPMSGPRADAIFPSLNEGQRVAVLGCALHRYNVLSGGAGVGKTYTIRAVVELAEEQGLRVATCAPTGKAARRLEQATDRESSTIHRLLVPRPDNAGGFKFTRNASSQLPLDLIIVDEWSMTDIKLMESLLDAVAPSTRLLLVGDHNQIPSVGPGAMLRDILGARNRFPGSVHVLTEIVRQAGVLARNTNAILDGLVVAVDDPGGSWTLRKTSRGHEEGTAALVACLVEELATSPEPVAPFDRELDFAWDIQVLSPMRKGPMGTWALNVHLQKLRQRLLGNPEPEPTESGKAPKPLVGDRVIWTKNDYDLDLFNGTQAIVLEIRKGGAMELFIEDGREVTIPPSKRLNVEVAYALTIHKSQGSEWPCVILVGSSSHRIMHDRNLLYTGASRASEALYIMGDSAGLKSFATEKRSARRQTFGSFLVHGWRPVAWQVRDIQPLGVASD